MIDSMKNKANKDFMLKLMAKAKARKKAKINKANSKNRVVRVSKNIFILYRG